jgi:cob(I)alamin adenosyltransferase
MKIYTRTGDDGSTGLFGGARVPKASQRVHAYGTVDEANSAIGLARAAGQDGLVDELLAGIQADLFALGAELACVPGKEAKLKMRLLSIDDAARLENAIDASEAQLPALSAFVLPGGSPQSATLHYARTVVRRAEREVLAIDSDKPRAELVVYLNRLSDLLFSLARLANKRLGVPDVSWLPPRVSE